ncbi:hypothetical protein FRW55_03450 [Mycoplasma anserisalpingitidis]|uniref:Uncharacterized protein n=1 Tax=Mycoplasma anserisalpingitidis TaxID=519450 RepID=A0A5B8K0I9_9MOLU|nr:hypothetical protein [Mycoplasma anserisalpingitidis]QDY87188.1 hypothetical protein FRW55_03450 [Mycoplasma anserisalpingitidis]
MLDEIKIIKTAKDLDLSFDFKITSFNERTFEINIEGIFRNLEFNEKYYEWFMEDLIDFLLSNKYQLRWDIGLINLHNSKNLKLSDEEIKKLASFFDEKVTSFDVKIID